MLSQKTIYDGVYEAAQQVEADIANGPIVGTATPGEIREHLARYDFSKPLELDSVAGDVEQLLRKWQVHITHPRYLGLFNPSVTPASVVGDTLAALYNPQLATWRTSPAANEIERHVLRWLSRKFGMPETSVAHFTSGGSEANLSAVEVALAHHFPEVGEVGLRGLAKTPVMYVAGNCHYGWIRIARLAGLGNQALRSVATTADKKLDMDDLRRKVAADRTAGLAPFFVVATAGTTSAGVIDPLPETAEFCRAEKLWFHADAAWGGAAIVSPKLKHHLTGIEQADSITCDAHKWFSVPMGAGMFFCRHADSVRRAFESSIGFMPAKTADTYDNYTMSMQWSRRFIGLKLFLSIAERGEAGYAEMIEHQARMGDVLRDKLTKAGWRIVNNTPFPLVLFTRDGLVTSRFLAELYKRQIAWMSEVHLDEGTVLRACITSYRTSEDDLDQIVRRMSEIGA